MTDHAHHDELLDELSDQLQDILNDSSQAIYLYMDDTHKVCNQHFADLLGYASPDEWTAITEPFPQAFVATQSHSALVGAFQKAMTEKAGSTVPITWVKKDKETVDTTVILVPISLEGHLFALHFVTTNR